MREVVTPELLRPANAAALLDISESAWRALWPVLVAEHGLQVVELCGPKFRRANILAVLDRLVDRGVAVRLDQAGRRVFLGDRAFAIRSSRVTGRGRKAVQL